MAKIASHFEVPKVEDLVLRLGDLDLVYGVGTSECDLNKKLFQDLAFTEANLIGVQIINSSRQKIVARR